MTQPNQQFDLHPKRWFLPNHQVVRPDAKVGVELRAIAHSSGIKLYFRQVWDGFNDRIGVIVHQEEVPQPYLILQLPGYLPIKLYERYRPVVHEGGRDLLSDTCCWYVYDFDTFSNLILAVQLSIVI